MGGSIDLRSDTVTLPTPAMRDAMASAELGDDVLGHDPTVARLEAAVAERLGKEAACFVPSGTMANQLAMRSLTEPGDAIIAHRDSHILHYETGAPAAVSGCTLYTVDGSRGRFGPEAVERACREWPSWDDHHPLPRVVSLENTHNRGGGAVWPVDAAAAVSSSARRLGLRVHMDGARLWNACVAAGVEPSAYGALADTVSVCFSKGLGCPVGSAVAGDRAMVGRARRFRKMLGGAMRQSGVLAGAALYALEHHVSRLAEDHVHARRLAAAMAACPGLEVDVSGVETNIVYASVSEPLVSAGVDGSAVASALEASGVRVLGEVGGRMVRAVTHLGVTSERVDRACAVFGSVLGRLTEG